MWSFLSTPHSEGGDREGRRGRGTGCGRRRGVSGEAGYTSALDTGLWIW